MSLIGFTGTRLGMNEVQQRILMAEMHRLGATELHHGDCRGADEQAHAIARQLGLRIIGHPPVAEGLRAFCECDELRAPQEFMARNHVIVLETINLLATPEGPERRRSGTWATVRYARKISHPCEVITPDGVIVRSDFPDGMGGLQ